MMSGVRFGWLAIATAAASILAGNSASAADMPQLPPPQMTMMPVPVLQNFEGWYLRGDVGVGMTQLGKFEWIPNPAGNPTDFAIETFSIGDSAFVGAGIGYEYNNWLRFDITGEYRSKASIFAFGTYTAFCAGACQDVYNAHLKSWVFLANAYADLGTWWCFTPFVGVGIGGAYNKFESLTDFGPQTGGRGFGRNSAEWDTAWALHAGVAYAASKNLKIELAYRYLNMGSVTDLIDCVGGCLPDSYRLKDITSHDFRIGLRVLCCETPREQPYVYPQPAYVPQPQVLTVPPTYAPPPQQPPLVRKG